MRKLLLGCLIPALPLLALAAWRWAMGTDDVPAWWNHDEIGRAVPVPADRMREAWAAGPTSVLAWKVVQDRRPFTVEHCLVLQRQAGPTGAERWVITGLFRHPDGGGRWEVGEVRQFGRGEDGKIWCHGTPHYQVYETRPRNAEVYAFMDRVGWDLGAEGDWRLLRAAVCVQAWREEVGEEPTRLFQLRE